MRVFVGLDLDSEIRERIAAFIAEMRQLAPEVRWVTLESLHVTLKFIGEKPDSVVEQIRDSLGAVSASAFNVSFRGCGFFPTAKSARVFWIGIVSDTELARLASQVEDTLLHLGIPKEDRAFSPHLTLARSGTGAPKQQRGDRANSRFAKLQEKIAQIPAPDFGTMAAHEFFLYRSQLSSQGSRYTKIARFELRSES